MIKPTPQIGQSMEALCEGVGSHGLFQGFKEEMNPMVQTKELGLSVCVCQRLNEGGRILHKGHRALATQRAVNSLTTFRRHCCTPRIPHIT